MQRFYDNPILYFPCRCVTKFSPTCITIRSHRPGGTLGQYQVAAVVIQTLYKGPNVQHFLETLRIQRWDDHRYYHHDRINQTLHLVSALSFVTAYVFLFIDPIVSALLAWLVSMTTRQAGHFFFEPHAYDTVNQATHAYKEEIKVGYNLRRKVVLMAVWALSPILVWLEPTLFGLLASYQSPEDFVRTVGALWLALGAGGLLFRVLQLLSQQGAQTALAWMTKILTDPFHDIMLYWKAPIYLMRGQRTDPMHHIHLG